jgi:hypothetical protein
MHETHPGVQDMACDTFLKICSKCKRKFVVLQLGEAQPFVAELLDALAPTIQDLQPHQVHSFYESVGLMIGAESEFLFFVFLAGGIGGRFVASFLSLACSHKPPPPTNTNTNNQQPTNKQPTPPAARTTSRA